MKRSLALRTSRGGHTRMTLFTRTIVVALTCIGGFPISSAFAQGHPTDTTVLDTGRLRRGWSDFTRYNWGGAGGMCAAGVVGQDWLVQRRDGRLDTMAYKNITQLSVAAPARAIAEQCGAAVLAHAPAMIDSGVANGTFIAITRLALALRQDSLVMALIDRQAARQPTVGERIYFYGYIRKLLHEGPPPRLDLVDRIISRIDTMGNLTMGSTVNERVRAHAERFLDQVKLGDTVAMQRELDVVDTLKARIWAAAKAAGSPSIVVDGDIGSYMMEAFGYHTKFDLALMAEGRTGKHLRRLIQWADSLYPGAISIGVNFVPDLLKYGKPLQLPDSETFWFRPRGDSASAADSLPLLSIPPVRPGHVTLVALGPFMSLATPQLSSMMLKWWAPVQRAQAAYGAKGLDVMLFTETDGWTPWTWQLAPVQEAQEYRHLVQNTLRAPNTTIGVMQSSFIRRPGVDSLDGRWKHVDHPWMKELRGYFGFHRWSWAIVDQHGKVVWLGARLGADAVESEGMLDLYLKKMFPETPPAGT